MKNRKVLNYCGNGLLFLLVGITILVLCIFLVRVFSLGGKVLSWEFLFTAPRNCMQEGGIFPALVGTFLAYHNFHWHSNSFRDFNSYIFN